MKIKQNGGWKEGKLLVNNKGGWNQSTLSSKLSGQWKTVKNLSTEAVLFEGIVTVQGGTLFGNVFYGYLPIADIGSISNNLTKQNHIVTNLTSGNNNIIAISFNSDTDFTYFFEQVGDMTLNGYVGKLESATSTIGYFGPPYTNALRWIFEDNIPKYGTWDISV